MKSDDMILKAAIVHILDSSVGVPVLSDHLIDTGTDEVFIPRSKFAEPIFPICLNPISKRSPKATI